MNENDIIIYGHINNMIERLESHSLYINEEKNSIILNSFDDVICMQISEINKTENIIYEYIIDSSIDIVNHDKSTNKRLNYLIDGFIFDESYIINSRELNWMLTNIEEIFENMEGRFVVADGNIELVPRTGINTYDWYINFDINLLLDGLEDILKYDDTNIRVSINKQWNEFPIKFEFTLDKLIYVKVWIAPLRQDEPQMFRA